MKIEGPPLDNPASVKWHPEAKPGTFTMSESRDFPTLAEATKFVAEELSEATAIGIYVDGWPHVIAVHEATAIYESLTTGPMIVGDNLNASNESNKPTKAAGMARVLWRKWRVLQAMKRAKEHRRRGRTQRRQ